MIPRAVSALFPPAVKLRGDAYWTSSRVRIDEADARVIKARIRGARIYDVEIDATDGLVRMACNCPYAADAGACKHIWALFRVANHKELLERLLHTAGTDPRYDFRAITHPAAENRTQVAHHVTAAPPVDWKRAIARARAQLTEALQVPATSTQSAWPDNKRLAYLLDVDSSATANGVVIDLGLQSLHKDGTWGEPRRFTLARELWFAASDAVDQHIAQMLVGADPANAYANTRTVGFVIPPRAFDLTLRPIIETGRCLTRSNDPLLSGRTVSYDAGPAWQFRLKIQTQDANAHTVHGVLVREDVEMSLDAAAFINANGFLLANGSIARFDSSTYSPLLVDLRSHGAITVNADIAELLRDLHALPQTPGIELPVDSSVKVSNELPALSATIAALPDEWRKTPVYQVRCSFRYGNMEVAADSPGNSIFDEAARVLYRRQPDVERAALDRLRSLGARSEWDPETPRRIHVVSQQKLTRLATALVRDGWHVQLDGVQLRAAGPMRATVSSGIDWFDLAGTVTYGDEDVSLARVLDARRRGLDVIPLADGGLGMLPVWLNRLGVLAATGTTVNDSTRFNRSQLPLLDVLLATLPEIDIDESFATARAELAQFRAIQPLDPPPSFHGVLREYQRDGLGWMHFLRQFALGGCLADDMGLGKTVQVLAMLEARRIGHAGASILVVPRSLVFNWIREAERFTPRLRILDYSNTSRDLGPLDDVDVVITTYGTLRRDAPYLLDREFDYAILDEAQAIKNANTASAKACRLLRARHRLVLTGTPVENRIEELWSLLEFLNPGMLGVSAKFAALANRESSEEPVDDVAGFDHALLSQALRPVILRRTKEKVAAELPERVEQTLEVELEPKQRRFYDSIRDEQRARVMDHVDRVGMRKSQMHILEALLRLRQAACHPGLADNSKMHLPSAKLDALVPSLAEVTAEGHKALVFSQFTGFLALVRERLDEAGIVYEYLDGKTTDREARVERFQNDETCPVFLISLRAGGQGLNLTRADYVYLLDPWWNPAVEAQAIDRAHRIGQTQRVLATRLVARDTIEEKILQLQSSKRALADAILGGDRSVLASIGREELELLLG